MCSVNERRRYNVAWSFIGWCHTQNNPWYMNAKTFVFADLIVMAAIVYVWDHHRFCCWHRLFLTWKAQDRWFQEQIYRRVSEYLHDTYAKSWIMHIRVTLQWRHNERDGASNHQHHDCLPTRLFRHRSKKTSNVCVIGLCAGNSPLTGEFPAERASNAEKVSICWRHHL